MSIPPKEQAPAHPEPAAGSPAPKKKSSWLNLLIDYGPVLVFFIAYRMSRPEGGEDAVGEIVAITKSTGAFIIATIVALAVSKWKLGKISPMLWLSSVLVVGFGALTMWSQDEAWISRKPSVVYLLFAIALFWGWWRGKPTLRYLLESAFEGLDADGWMKLSRNWAFFFLFLAGLNEVLANRDWFTFEQWLSAKLVVFMPLSFIFTFAHIPMLLRHGLASQEEEEVVTHPPHE